MCPQINIRLPSKEPPKSIIHIMYNKTNPISHLSQILKIIQHNIISNKAFPRVYRNEIGSDCYIL
jgi:hypothetical protein